MKILLADDEPTNLHVATVILEGAGYTVIPCRNGEEVLALSESGETFDLFLIDLVMPLRDGYATIEALRGKAVSAPIVALSANVFKESMERALRAGADAFVGKPYRRADLLSAIGEAMGSAMPPDSENVETGLFQI